MRFVATEISYVENKRFVDSLLVTTFVGMEYIFRCEAFTFPDADELALGIHVYLNGYIEKLTEEKIVDYQIAYTTFEENEKRMYSAIVSSRCVMKTGKLN